MSGALFLFSSLISLYREAALPRVGRDILAAEAAGNERAILARRMFSRRIVKYIGAYYALLGGADVVVFTGGIGEMSPPSRAYILDELGCLGIAYDKELNANTRGKRAVISTADSKVTVVVMPTDEEKMIARSTVETLKLK